MYRKHFGLARHPFAKDLAPEDLSGQYRVLYVPLSTGNVTDPAASPGTGPRLANWVGMRLVISRRTFALEDVPSELDLSDLHMFRGANWRGRQRMLLAPAREAPRILAELAERGVRLADEDVRAAAACALADDPVEGAVGVAAFGDPRAIPELSRALDAYTPSTDCVVCDFFAVSSRGQAIEALGGTLTPAQRAKIAEFHERQKGAWIGWPGRDATEASGTRMVPAFIQAAPAAATAPVRRAPRPGRNDPCHCGSGQKYKRCHLDADTRSGGPTETRH